MQDNNTRLEGNKTAPSQYPPNSVRETGAKISESFSNDLSSVISRSSAPLPLVPTTTESELRFAKESDEFYPEDGTGKLVVRVQTALGSFPVEESTVIISRNRNGQNEIVNFQLTDKSGLTKEITVPAPRKADSLQPSDRFPFSDYNITVQHPLYYTAAIENVQVFGDELSVQVVELTPLPELVNETNITKTIYIPRQNL